MAGADVIQGTWAVTAEWALRRLAALTWAGAILGLVVGGVGGRFAMMLLAKLDAKATGVKSDDGFTMGQMSLQTLNLLVITTLIGVLGGGIYFVLRTLLIGPRWFEVLSVSLGPAVVVGSSLVHVEGVDFTLEPTWLAIAMFIAIPGIYGALLTHVGERWIRPEGRFAKDPRRVVLLPLLLWVSPLAPFLGALLLALAAVEGARRTTAGNAILSHPAWPWAARAALTVLFVMALADLAQTTATLLETSAARTGAFAQRLASR
jgi:hypothetical protein